MTNGIPRDKKTTDDKDKQGQKADHQQTARDGRNQPAEAGKPAKNE